MKKYALKKTLILFLGAAILLAGFSPCFAGDGHRARITALEGDVAYKNPNQQNQQWAKASAGQELSEGSYLMTAFESSCDLEFIDGSKMKIKELTKIQINKYSAGLKEVEANLTLYEGKIRATVHKDVTKKTEFSVRTPGSIIAVRGTEKEITYFPGLGTQVQNVNGLIEVVNLMGQKVTLARGDELGVKDGAKKPGTISDAMKNRLRSDFVKDESMTPEEEEARLNLLRSDFDQAEDLARDLFEIVRENEFFPTTIVKLNWSAAKSGK